MDQDGLIALMKNKIKKIFTKKYGKWSLNFLFFRVVKCFVIIYIPIAILAIISESSVKSNKYAAILLSAHAITDYDYWAPPIAFLGSYPAWTFYFNSKSFKTDFIFSATKKDFFKVLKDEKYQSIVLVGHGSFNSWRATDSLITNTEVNGFKDKFEKKDGEWFQLTCPSKDFDPVQLGELVMNNTENVFYYSGEIAADIDFIIDALTGFSRIKDQTYKRRKVMKPAGNLRTVPES